VSECKDITTIQRDKSIGDFTKKVTAEQARKQNEATLARQREELRQ